jgi:hypothetical protein
MDGEDDDDGAELTLSFDSTVIYWRGPAPFFYAPAPPGAAAEIGRVARAATYGWGCIPVMASVGGVAFKTSLFPKDGTFLLPLKVAVRRQTDIPAGDTIAVEMTIRLDRRDRRR